MVLMWDVLSLALCAMLAVLALLRGLAGLLVSREALPRVEATSLALAGVMGLIGVVVVERLVT